MGLQAPVTTLPGWVHNESAGNRTRQSPARTNGLQLALGLMLSSAGWSGPVCMRQHRSSSGCSTASVSTHEFQFAECVARQSVAHKRCAWKERVRQELPTQEGGQGLAGQPGVGRVRYISPEHGGFLESPRQTSTKIFPTARAGWTTFAVAISRTTSGSRARCYFDGLSYRVLREIETEQYIKPDYLPITFSTTIDRLNTLLDRVQTKTGQRTSISPSRQINWCGGGARRNQQW